MKSVNQLLERTLQGQNELIPQSMERSDTSSRMSAGEAREERLTLLKATFKKLSNYRLIEPDEEMFRDWGNALKDVSDEQMARGAKRAQTFTGFFTLPKFLELCLMSDEFPPARAAFLEAMTHAHEWKTYQFSHPVVLGAMKCSNIKDLREMPEKYSSKIYYRNYAIVCKKFASGLPIDTEVPLALPEKVEVRMTPAARKEQMKFARDLMHR